MKNEDASEHLIPPHGGYSKLVTYKLGILIYDATAAFCEHYFDRKDRTFDQMVQAARSGVANIVEGSQASATSKKTELKLTNVAKASQEELLEDYRSFLRQRNLPLWDAQSAQAQTVRQQLQPCSMSYSAKWDTVVDCCQQFATTLMAQHTRRHTPPPMQYR